MPRTISKTNSTRRSKKFKTITEAQRKDMIEKVAYFIAERRGFQGGDPQQDWVEAEKQVERHFPRPAAIS